MPQFIRFNLIACAIVAAFGVSSSRADDFGLGSIADTAGWNVGYELTFLRAHRSQGTTTDDVYDFDYAPRFTVEYQACNGAGARLTYWDYDHEGFGAAPSAIDTSNFDLDIFRRTQIGCGTDIEMSAGLRWHDYQDFNWAVGGVTDFDALGGSIGLRVRQQLGFGIVGYARGKWSILMNDAINSTAVPALQFDAVRDHQEIAFGFQNSFCVGKTLTTAHAGLEWMNWNGYDDNGDGAIGFSGFAFGATVNF